MQAPKNIGKDQEVKRLSVKDHLNGVVTAYADGRTPLKGLKSAGNQYLTQNGTIRPRPSLVRLGPQPTGTVLGEIFEFKKVSGTTSENWLICMQSFNVSASPSASVSPSASISPSSSRSPSASDSPSLSISPSASRSPSASSSSSVSPSRSPSASTSPSASRSPSASISASRSPSASLSPSASVSISPSASASPSASSSPSASPSASSAPITAYAQVYIARIEDTSWTAVPGKYYDGTARAHYFQIAGKVVILNGSDYPSYLDIPTSTITSFVALSTPATPTLNANNVGSGVFNITYRITDNSTVGETSASNVLTVPVDTDRDFWNPPSAGGTDSIVINLPAAQAGVQSRNIYMGTVAGSEYLIKSGISNGATTFTDDGTFSQDNTRLYPTVNSTAAPRATRGANIGGRAFLVGDVDSLYKVWNGGDPGFELDFSPANGGGYSVINSGGKELPIAVKLHRDGKGSPVIKVYCNGTKGKRFSMVPDQVTLGDVIIPFYAVTEDEGESGTNAPDAILYYNNSMYYPSPDGFDTDGTLPSIQNVLASRKLSNTIQTDIPTLNQSAMDMACGFVLDGRLCWSLPVGSSENNEIWVLDVDHKGAWMKPWSIPADWMWVITDNTGGVHHMLLVNNVIYDFSYSSLTNDDGEPFLTDGQSGQVYFSDDKRMWVQLLQVIIVLSQAQGSMNWLITGKTEDSNLQALGEPTTFTASASTIPVGWSEVVKGAQSWGQNPWGQTSTIPAINSATEEILIEIDETVQWAAYNWNSQAVGVDYAISDIIFEYVEVGILDLS